MEVKPESPKPASPVVVAKPESPKPASPVVVAKPESPNQRLLLPLPTLGKLLSFPIMMRNDGG